MEKQNLSQKAVNTKTIDGYEEAQLRIAHCINNKSSELDLSELGLTELPKQLANCTQLVRLNCKDNQLTQIDILSELKNLKELSIRTNKLRDLTPLADLINLRMLDIRNNQIQDLEPLKNLNNLHTLYANNNKISNPTPVLSLANLRVIYLSNNNISDCPDELLDDLAGLRAHYGISTSNSQSEIKNPASKKTKSSKQNTPTTKGKKPTKTPPKTNHKNTPFTYEETPVFSVNSKPKDALLGVKEQASIFAKLILNAKDSEEKFFGIFGRWGRGKTFFWKQVVLALGNMQSTQNKILLPPITFHAWKYQDTPAIWAYLYETMIEAYFSKNIVRRFFQKLDLNWERGVFKKWVWWISKTLGLAVLLILLEKFITAKGYTAYAWPYYLGGGTLTIASIHLIPQLIKILKEHTGTRARDFLQQATAQPTYLNHLGVQHEMQRELALLLKTWLANHPNKQLILFIDDIDRCEESKIVEIVDAIRVMLEEPNIMNNLMVVAAIDERILLRAIHNKYQRLIQDEKKLSTIVREQMDKLFVLGIRLSALSADETGTIVDAFSEQFNPPKEEGVDGEIESSLDKTSEGITSHPTSIAQQIKEEQQVLTTLPPQDDDAETPSPPIDGVKFIKNDSNIIFTKEENELLKTMAGKMPHATPRKIRVFTLRFALTKQLMQHVLKENAVGFELWYSKTDLRAKQYVAEKLIEFGVIHPRSALTLEYEKKVQQTGEMIQETFGTEKIQLPRSLATTILRVLEMVITY